MLARIRLWWEFYWAHVVIVFLVLASVLLPLWFLTRLEPSVAYYIMGFNVLSLPFNLINTCIFVFFLYFLQYGGWTDLTKKKLDPTKVNVHLSDVIGLTEPKREALEMIQLIQDRALLRRVGGRIIHGM